MAAFLRGLLSCGSFDRQGTVITRPGLFNATPESAVGLLVPGPVATSALTGPDTGVSSIKQQPVEGADAPSIAWQCPQADTQQQHQHQQRSLQASPLAPGNNQQQELHHQPQHSEPQQQQPQQRQQPAWGCASSLYDRDPLTGQRNGDPVADCYGVVTYQHGAVMALADGVNWGQRSRLAARAAVLGFCTHLHQQLALKQGGQALSSTAAFAAIRQAVLAAHKQVLAAEGTLTTLIGALVCRQRWGTGHVLLAVAVGDSPCYVWRAATGCVEEVTHLPPMHGFHRDPRVCPGCLGYAIGDQPDLSNITFSLTHLAAGDLVFLASDGIADNFDPVMRKQALPSASSLPGKSPRAPAAAQAAAQAALAAADCSSTGNGAGGVGGCDYGVTNHAFQLCPANPATCHAWALADMARVLRGAVSQHRQQKHQPRGGQLDAKAGLDRAGGKHKRQQQQQQQQQQQCQQHQQHYGGCNVPPELLNAPGVVIPGMTRSSSNSNLSLPSTGSSSGGGIMQQQQQKQKVDALSLTSSNAAAAGSQLPPFQGGAALTPTAAVSALMGFVTAATAAQRQVLEDPTRVSCSGQLLSDLLADLPGKLDHASVVAYKVGGC